MKILSIVGNVDKRIIALPIARACQLLGKTAIVTDNNEFTRLIENGNNIGNCHGVIISYKEKLTGDDEYVDFIEFSKERPKFVIYVSNTYINYKADKIVVVHGDDRSFLGDALNKRVNEIKDSLLEDQKAKVVDISITSNTVKDKKDTKRFHIGSNELIWLWKVDEYKEIIPFSSKEFGTILGYIGSAIGEVSVNKFTDLLSHDQYLKAEAKKSMLSGLFKK